MYTTEQKLLILLCHLGVFLGIGVLAPAIVFFVTNDQLIKHHAKEALGFQGILYLGGLALGILGTIGGVLSAILIGIPLVVIVSLAGVALGIVGIVVPVMATVRSLNGEAYRYPFTSELINRLF